MLTSSEKKSKHVRTEFHGKVVPMPHKRQIFEMIPPLSGGPIDTSIVFLRRSTASVESGAVTYVESDITKTNYIYFTLTLT